jgi:hypothetical protein
MSLSTKYVFLLVKVMASKTKIYIVMELVTGGELFDKIVSAYLSFGYLNLRFSL